MFDDLRQVWAARVQEARRARNADGGPRSGGELEMTQADLAARLGVTQQAVSGWERGITVPRDAMKLRIAAALGRPVTDLFPLDAVPVPATPAVSRKAVGVADTGEASAREAQLGRGHGWRVSLRPGGEVLLRRVRLPLRGERNAALAPR